MTADRVAQAAVERLDETAAAMERRWGVDRLPRLVDPALAARFRAQAVKLDEALRADRKDAIAVQAAAMERAWRALDAAACATGAQPLSPSVWETRLPSSGEIVAVVRDAREAHAIAGERKGAVYTLAEVAVALEAFGDRVHAAKAAFPGAEVTAVRPRGLNIGATLRETRAGARSRSSGREMAAKPQRGMSDLFCAPAAHSSGRPSTGARGPFEFDDEIPF